MQGPHVFEEKDPNAKYKYAVGDWIKSDGHGSFWKIREQLILDHLPAFETSQRTQR